MLSVQQFSSLSVMAWAAFSGLFGIIATAIFWKPRGPGVEAPTASFQWDRGKALRGAMWAALPASLLGVAIGLEPDVLSDPEQPFSDPVASALFFSALVALLTSAIVFPFAGWRATIPTQHHTPNAGVWRSLRNAIWMPAAVTVAGLLFARWIDPDLTSEWYAAIATVGVIWALLRGGLFCLQHLAVKLIVRVRGYGPWRYATFLNAAAQLLLLRKVGGGYVFVHRMLLDYLASLDGTIGPSQALVLTGDSPTAQLPQRKIALSAHESTSDLVAPIDSRRQGMQ
jgi:hypothetical protein